MSVEATVVNTRTDNPACWRRANDFEPLPDHSLREAHPAHSAHLRDEFRCATACQGARALRAAGKKYREIAAELWISMPSDADIAGEVMTGGSNDLVQERYRCHKRQLARRWLQIVGIIRRPVGISRCRLIC